MSKHELLERIVRDLRDHLSSLDSAAAESKQAATDPDSRAEGKYDTRALEASYLAGAQAEQVDKLRQSVTSLEGFTPRPYDLTEPVGPGALVEGDLDGETVFFFLLPGGGGHSVEHLGCDLTVLAPEAPLYQKLLHRKAGDMIDQPAIMVLGCE
jgi:hypothetical protein